MAEVIETYRALVPLLVGPAMREVGEYVPEALAWPRPTVASLERVHRLERIFVSEEALNACMEKVRAREEELLSQEAELIEEEGDEVDADDTTDPTAPVTQDDGEKEPETPKEEEIEGLGAPEPEDPSDSGKKKIVRRSK